MKLKIQDTYVLFQAIESVKVERAVHSDMWLVRVTAMSGATYWTMLPDKQHAENAAEAVLDAINLWASL